MRLRTCLSLSFAVLTVFTIAALLLIAERGIDDITVMVLKRALPCSK